MSLGFGGDFGRFQILSVSGNEMPQNPIFSSNPKGRLTTEWSAGFYSEPALHSMGSQGLFSGIGTVFGGEGDFLAAIEPQNSRGFGWRTSSLRPYADQTPPPMYERDVDALFCTGSSPPPAYEDALLDEFFAQLLPSRSSRSSAASSRNSEPPIQLYPSLTSRRGSATSTISAAVPPIRRGLAGVIPRSASTLSATPAVSRGPHRSGSVLPI